MFISGQRYYFTKCNIGKIDENNRFVREYIAYANEMHHFKPKFSWMSVSGEEDNGEKATWICRVISFLEIILKTENEEGIATLVFYGNFSLL